MTLSSQLHIITKYNIHRNRTGKFSMFFPPPTFEMNINSFCFLTYNKLLRTILKLFNRKSFFFKTIKNTIWIIAPP